MPYSHDEIRHLLGRCICGGLSCILVGPPGVGKTGLVRQAAEDCGIPADAFLALNLSAVLPMATLAHLGASVSKNPFSLVPTDTTGVRQS